ncbi:cytochrome P450 [Nocardia bhagyanarayanae]|uniref:Cytochrome P450 n=1 Tax=Nocardia bhagyanarayanae TaxID=1215925 RepID=A0A543FD72_9NOCA|nr:cytochrome P450 [Nocardia bhagyanarayanae]TQM31732.1 cytochrome P450 [Nocardia bhagyanarayanae]
MSRGHAPTVAGYPPGPVLPVFAQSYLYIRYRAALLPVLRRRYGEVFSLRIPPFADRLVVFSRPEHVKEIFAGDPYDMHAGEANNILGPVMGPHSVLLTDEAEHARARKLLMPAFNGTALRGYRDLVSEIAAAETAGWRPGSTVVTLDRMNALTLEVIMRVVFGVTDERTRAELAPRLHRIVTISPLQYAGLRIPRLQRYWPWRSFHDTLAAIDDLLYREIAERRSAPDLADRTDVLSRLLQVGGGEAPLSDAELRDQLVTLLLAGHETTAAALSWALYELAADPALQLATYRAVRADDDKAVEAVLKEAMRLHTVIPGAVRKLTKDTTIGQWELPAGTTVSCSIFLAHRRPESYPDVAAFRPARFLDGEVEPNTWLPFGGGVRRCIGAGFALMEGTAVLREVLIRHTLALADARPERGRVRNITTVPRGKARIVVTPR